MQRLVLIVPVEEQEGTDDTLDPDNALDEEVPGEGVATLKGHLSPAGVEGSYEEDPRDLDLKTKVPEMCLLAVSVTNDSPKDSATKDSATKDYDAVHPHQLLLVYEKKSSET